MREQAVASRGSRRATTTKGFVQRPARRDNSTSSRWQDFSLRGLFAYAPSALKVILVILTVVTLIVGYRAAASASFFQLRGIDVSGTSRTSAEEIESLTRRAVSRTGVWRVDLTALSDQLSRLPGVRHAIVTRVLPDRVRVRVVERAPLAVVRTSAGHLVWVDDEGVSLGEMKPADHMPPFFIRGWSEENTDDARADNVERMQKYLEVFRTWGTLGLTERVSEVNLIDLHDVRAQLSGSDSQIEVRLGGQDLGNHLKLALAALDQYKQSADGTSVTYVDVQGDRVVLGTSSGNKVSNLSEASGSPTSTPGTSLSTASPRSSTNKDAPNARSATTTATTDEARKRRDAAAEKTQRSRSGKDERDRQR
jgi:POTRA domain, FtsQ-type